MTKKVQTEIALSDLLGLHSRQYQNSIVYRALLIILLWVSSLLNRWVNIDWFALAVIIVYILITLKVNYKFVLRYISAFSGTLLVLASIVIIESGGLWLSELQIYGYYCGVLPLCGSYYMLYLLILETYDQKYSSRMVRKTVSFSFHDIEITKQISRLANLGFIVFTAFLFLRVAGKPAFRLNYDRFDYRNLYLPGFWGTLSNYLLYLLPLILINWKNGNRMEAACAIGLYALFLFWTGERFTGFLSIMFYVSLFLVDAGKKRKKAKKARKRLSVKQVLVLGIVLILILGVVIQQYSRLYAVNAWVHLMERIAQQGQLWWAIYAKYRGTGLHLSELEDELQVFTHPESTPRYYGIYKIMYLCAPADIVTAKIEMGQNYTESTAATVYYYFGPVILMLFAVAMGIILAYLMRLYFTCIMENRIISVMILSRLLAVYRNFASMSRFNMLFGKGTLFLIFVFILLRLWRMSQKKDIQVCCAQH